MPNLQTRRAEGPALGQVLVLSDERADSRVELVPARGAIVTSFAVGGRELLYLDPATLADPSKNVRGGIPILFPSPGRLSGDRYACDGRAHAMKQHGFARELPWTPSATEGDAAEVTLTLTESERTLPQYPWPFRFDLHVALRGTALSLKMAVTNAGTAPLPFALGLHPYFAVKEKARVGIDTAATRAFDNVDKAVKPFTGFDLTAPELDLHLLDHGSTHATLTLEDGARIEVVGSSTFTRWVVWTVAGKPYVCLEPWTAPADALNTGEGLTRLAPGDVARASVEIALRT